uniref:Uncharacterized protein n=1 Tax=Trypanosoma vivax (strain Y486) TaxID=1055687 RepID=G0TTG2_TRYVY|nr:conserved hypothetical protein [Trypanosoma vivax Y486]
MPPAVEPGVTSEGETPQQLWRGSGLHWRPSLQTNVRVVVTIHWRGGREINLHPKGVLVGIGYFSRFESHTTMFSGVVCVNAFPPLR